MTGVALSSSKRVSVIRAKAKASSKVVGLALNRSKEKFGIPESRIFFDNTLRTRISVGVIVPIGVLNHLESIRRNFFYGVDGFDRKLAWIGWNMVLTSKKNGGLGVSSKAIFGNK
ncbi:hypothetical protein Tco_1288548 [Tanacetum coccineum]